MSMSFFPRTLPVLCGFSLILAACSALPEYSAQDNGRTASNDGSYKLAKDIDDLSPEEQHARAKALVDPNKMVQNNAYVKNADQVRKEQESQTRVARIERGFSVVKNEFRGLIDSVTRANIAPASGSADVSVKAVRTGVYSDRTRIVFDLDGVSDFQFDLDNQKNLLVLHLSADGWDASADRIYSQDKILKAYAAKRSQNGGSVVALKLKGPAKVVRSQKLGKNAAGYNRIFLDIAPL